MGSKPINISASRGSAILGLSKYKSPLVAFLELMEEKKPGFCNSNGFLKPEKNNPWVEPLNPKLASLRWGLAFEGAICELVGNITDREKLFIHPENDFITCHIDGIRFAKIQENKTAFEMAFKAGWGEPGTSLIPMDYQVQVQHQLACSGIQEANVNVLVFPKPPSTWEKDGFKLHNDPDFPDIGRYVISDKNGDYISDSAFARSLANLGFFHEYHCPGNEKLQSEMIDRYKAFWNDNILKEVLPPVSGYDDIKWMIPAPEGEIEASEEMRELWQEHIDIDEEIESMLERKKEIKNNFAIFVSKAIPKDSAEKGKLNLYAGNRKIATVSKPYPGIKISRSTVDRLKEDSPELYETLKKTSFADILGDIPLTAKQFSTEQELDEKLEKLLCDFSIDQQKFLKKLKLTKLLSRDNIVKQIEKTLPELYNKLIEFGVVEFTSPNSSLRISKPKKEL